MTFNDLLLKYGNPDDPSVLGRLVARAVMQRQEAEIDYWNGIISV